MTPSYLAIVWPLFLKYPYLCSGFRVGISRGEASIYAPLEDFRISFVTAFLLGLLGSTIIALHQIRIRVQPLKDILRATNEIEAGVFSVRANISSGDEFELLGSLIDTMAQKLGDDFHILETLQSVSDVLIDAEDRSVVAAGVVPAAVAFAGAKEGSLFVVHSDSGDAFSTLKDDLNFLAKCNVGGEFMSDDLKARVDEIRDRYRWVDGAGTDHSLLTDDGR